MNGKGWHGENQRHRDVQAKGALKNTLRQPTVRLSEEAITKFINNETGELTANGAAIALRTSDFIFISKEFAPHQIPELYSRIPKNVGYSGGAVSLEIKDGHVQIKNVNDEIKKHELAKQTTTSALSRQMHNNILKTIKELTETPPQQDGEAVFNLQDTGFGEYNRIIAGDGSGIAGENWTPELYYKLNKNRAFEIKWMTPEKYFRESADLHHSTVTHERQMIDSKTVDEYMARVKAGSKMPLPILDYTISNQEGRHRVAVAERMGIKNVPVFIIKDANIIWMPLDKAWAMRAKYAGVGGMVSKRPKELMDRLRYRISTGKFDPIPATKAELDAGILTEGKHRLIIAKELGKFQVPIEVVDA